MKIAVACLALLFTTACSKDSGGKSSSVESASLAADPSSSSLSVNLSASVQIKDVHLHQITGFLASLLPQISVANIDKALGSASYSGQVSIVKNLNCQNGGSVAIQVQANSQRSVSVTKINASFSSEQSSLTFSNCTIGESDPVVLNGTISINNLSHALEIGLNLTNRIHNLSIVDAGQLNADLSVTAGGSTLACPIQIAQSDSINGTLNANNGLSLDGTILSQLQGSICGSTVSKNIQVTF